MIGTHQKIIFRIWWMPIDCGPHRTDVFKPDTYCISCRESVVGLYLSCMSLSLNKSHHSSSVLSIVVYVSVPLDIYCNWKMQEQSFLCTVSHYLDLRRSQTLWITAKFIVDCVVRPIVHCTFRYTIVVELWMSYEYYSTSYIVTEVVLHWPRCIRP